MNPTDCYGTVSVLLFALGLYGALAARAALRRIMALNVMGSGVFLLLVSIAGRNPDEPPDPVPQALVLTGIVVAVSATALALVLCRRVGSAADSSTQAGSGGEDRR